MYDIETIEPLPSGSRTGYAVTFSGVAFSLGRIDALGRVKGFYYQSTPPAVRFSVALAPDDPSTLHFSCNGCTDTPLMQRELLLLLKGLDFVSQDTERLPFTTPQRDVKGRFLPTQPATAG